MENPGQIWTENDIICLDTPTSWNILATSPTAIFADRIGGGDNVEKPEVLQKDPELHFRMRDEFLALVAKGHSVIDARSLVVRSVFRKSSFSSEWPNAGAKQPLPAVCPVECSECAATSPCRSSAHRGCAWPGARARQKNGAAIRFAANARPQVSVVRWPPAAGAGGRSAACCV